jgi:hypothetical protein
MIKGYYKVKDLPLSVKQCWFYTGKHSSIHIVFNDIEYEIQINGCKHKIKLPIDQINIDLPSIKKLP